MGCSICLNLGHRVAWNCIFLASNARRGRDPTLMPSRVSSSCICSLLNKLILIEEDIQRVRRILTSIVETTFLGCFKVIEYLKENGIRLILPQGLRPGR
jgi:hypothetical protein